MHELEQLEDTLRRADVAYYENDVSLMSDEEYDELVEQYKQLTGGKLWMRTAEATRPGMQRANHEFPMLSLLKVRTQAELDAFIRTTGHPSEMGGYEMSPKIDGAGASLTFFLNIEEQEWELHEAKTRGDKKVGEIITHNVKVMQNLPRGGRFENLSVFWPYTKLNIRGEVYLTVDAFREVGGENRRNAAAGLLRRKVVTAHTGLLSFVAYRLRGYTEETGWTTVPHRFYWLAQIGFQVPPTIPYHVGISPIEYLNPAVCFSGLPYETDGSVLSVIDPILEDSLGETTQYPRYSVALKFEAVKAETVLRDIEWSANRTGRIVPTYVFDPVVLGGAKVIRATGHNLAQLLKLGARIGDTIEVHRSNDVIPQVLRVVKPSETSRPLTHPVRCPSCFEADLQKNLVDLLCLNSTCPEKVIGLFTHAAHRSRLDLTGLGEELAIGLVNAGVDSLAALYQQSVDDLTSIILPNDQALGKTRASKFYEALQRSKKIPWPRVFHSLGCPGLGEPEATVIAERYSLQELLEMDSVERKFALVAFEGVGETTAVMVSNWLDAEALTLYGLVDVLRTTPEPREGSNVPQLLEGQTWVVTGAYNRPGFRERLEKTLRAYGARVSGSVSGKTHKVVYGHDAATNNKYLAAKQRNIDMLDEEQVLGLLGELNIHLLEA